MKKKKLTYQNKGLVSEGHLLFFLRCLSVCTAYADAAINIPQILHINQIQKLRITIAITTTSNP